MPCFYCLLLSSSSCLSPLPVLLSSLLLSLCCRRLLSIPCSLSPLLFFWYLFLKVCVCTRMQHAHSQSYIQWNNMSHYRSRPAGSFVIKLFVFVCCSAHIHTSLSSGFSLLHQHTESCLSFFSFFSFSFFCHLSRTHMSKTALHKATASVLNRARNSIGFDLESA